MSRTFDWLGGFLLGAAAMSLVDPKGGPRRRVFLRGKTIRAFHGATDFLDRAVRDLRNRASGAVAEARARRRSDEPEDRVLIERVRSKLGRHAAHPHAIGVDAHRGRVTLSGSIPDARAADLLAATATVPGVQSVLDRLEHEEADELDAPSPCTSPRRAGPWAVARWSPGVQLLAGIGGALVITTGAALLVRSRRHRPRTSPDYASLVA